MLVNGIEHRQAHLQITDTSILILAILLTGLGLACLFSASFYYAQANYQNAYYFLFKQAIFACLGVIAYFVASRMPVKTLQKLTPILYTATIVLLLLCFLPVIGRKMMGAYRWLNIFGFSFQPSEIAKPVIVLYLAGFISKREDEFNESIGPLIRALLLSGLLIGIVFLQNDFSTSIFLLGLTGSILFIGCMKLRYLAGLFIAGVPLTIMMLLSREHRVQRMIAFLYPENDPFGSSYQITAARAALDRGGFWGVGLGEGWGKRGALPEVHSDLVFASFGEELGFAGVLFALLLFVVFAFQGYSIAFGSNNRYSFITAFGLTTAILYQALMNISVVSGLVPATGVPLPFFSAGGSSIVITLGMCGLLAGIARSNAGEKGGAL